MDHGNRAPITIDDFWLHVSAASFESLARMQFVEIHDIYKPEYTLLLARQWPSHGPGCWPIPCRFGCLRLTGIVPFQRVARLWTEGKLLAIFPQWTLRYGNSEVLMTLVTSSVRKRGFLVRAHGPTKRQG